MLAWKITEDRIAAADEANVATLEVRSPNYDDVAMAGNLPKIPFQMLDDDGVIYYIGHYLCLPEDIDFDPLDDFGMPNAGCTTIKYLEDGKWKVL